MKTSLMNSVGQILAVLVLPLVIVAIFTCAVAGIFALLGGCSFYSVTTFPALVILNVIMYLCLLVYIGDSTYNR